jgi:alkylation response protein AidB-like acyl-CoA dehydrogenase
VAGVSLQVHGGIGFTREVAAHLHVKRARVNAVLPFSVREHRRRAAAYIPQLLQAWST